MLLFSSLFAGMAGVPYDAQAFENGAGDGTDSGERHENDEYGGDEADSGDSFGADESGGFDFGGFDF